MSKFKHYWSRRVREAQPQCIRIFYSTHYADAMFQVDNKLLPRLHFEEQFETFLSLEKDCFITDPRAGMFFPACEELLQAFTEAHQQYLNQK